MAGNKAGGLKARDTNLKKHGENYYKEIGAKGGKASTTGGFHAKPELAKIAGAKGGRNSSRDGVPNGYNRINGVVVKREPIITNSESEKTNEEPKKVLKDFLNRLFGANE